MAREICSLHENFEEKINKIFEKLSERKSSDDVQDERLNNIEKTIVRIENKLDCFKKQLSQVSTKVAVMFGVFSTFIAIMQVWPTIKQVLH